MLTMDILEKYTYQSVGGPLDAVPVTSIIHFLNRVRDRISDVQDGTVTLKSFDQEIIDTIHGLNRK